MPQALLLNVQDANQIWKAAGVQFWIRSVESYVMPDFYDMTPWGSPHSWSSVEAELAHNPNAATPFPGAPTDAWLAGKQKSKPDWLRAVAAVYAEPNEITVWLKQAYGDNTCNFPSEGRSCIWNEPPLAYHPYYAAHEIGHFLGLAHTFQFNDHNDPSTQQPWKRSDRWDLVYKWGTSPANPNKYYDDLGQAEADEGSLRLINNRPSRATPGDADNCSIGAAGIMTCRVGASATYYETLQTGHAGLKGLSFPQGNADYGENIMAYTSNTAARPKNISDSQVEIVRKFLRWEQQFTTANYNAIYDGFNYPVPTTSGLRTRLGSWRQRQPGAKLDFDGDGLRDIGVWIPPKTLGVSGEFIVLLSGNGYSQVSGQDIDVAFGGLGDTPVPADYTGDGHTNLAVYQPGGGINRDDPTDHAGYWRWCPTTSCSSPTVTQFGWREDAPEPGLDFDGSAPDALAVYRPSNGAYYFKELSWSNYTKVTISSADSGAVPLPGQYDCDDEADLAVYEPMTAQFKLVGSMQNWDASQMITRQFSTNFIPHMNGSLTDVAGVVPVAGQRYVRWCWNGSWYSLKSRLSAVVFYPQDGTWNMMMNPVSSASVTGGCILGTPDSAPIGGIDWNGDGQSDMFMFDGGSYSGWPFTLYEKNTTWSDCSGAEHVLDTTAGAQRRRTAVYSVSDMDGDGLNDLLIVDPDQGIVRWLTSSSGFQTEHSRTFGDPWMEVL